MSKSEPHPETTFNADWLAMRAPADTAARAESLTALAACWLTERRAPDSGPLALADLGTGTGSNARFLAPRLPGPQRWQLIDHDDMLLEQAQINCRGLCACDGSTAEFATLTRDLDKLGNDDLLGFDLISASALIDLVSDDWLNRFAQALAHAGAATLIALSVNGEWRFSRTTGNATKENADEDRDDALVRAAFNDHQRRDKGVGGALGPDAAPRLAHLLRQQGYRVMLAPSPWRLPLGGGPETDLAHAVLDGWRDAAQEQMPHARERITDWHSRRRASLAQPALMLTLGHVDLFACPVDTWPAAGPHA